MRALPRIHLVQYLVQAGLFASIVYTSIHLDALGAGSTFIGITTTAYAVATLGSSHLFGVLGDRLDRRDIMRIGALVSTFLLLELALSPGIWTFALFRVLTGVSLGMMVGSVIAYASDSGVKMGRLSSFGAFGWATAGYVSGLIGVASGVFAFSAIALALAFLMCIVLAPADNQRISVPLFPLRIIRRNSAAYLPFLIRHSGAFAIWTFYPLILLDMGASFYIIGIIYALNPVVQTVLMPFVDRFAAASSIAIGLALSALTFVMFVWAPTWQWMLVAQVPLGMSWSFLYVGTLNYLTSRNREKATVGGMFGSTLSSSAILGPVLATVLLAGGVDYDRILLAAAILSDIALVLFFPLRVWAERRWPSEVEGPSVLTV